MRTPSSVAEQIREVVPEEHKERFARLMSDFSYKALEQWGSSWVQLSVLCNELLGLSPLSTASEDWQVEMIAILTTLSKEELLRGRSV